MTIGSRHFSIDDREVSNSPEDHLVLWRTEREKQEKEVEDIRTDREGRAKWK